jgi:hypothetical protein
MTKAVDLPPEIAVRKDLWEMLLPEEKKKRTDDYTKKQKEKTDARSLLRKKESFAFDC